MDGPISTICNELPTLNLLWHLLCLQNFENMGNGGHLTKADSLFFLSLCQLNKANEDISFTICMYCKDVRHKKVWVKLISFGLSTPYSWICCGSTNILTNDSTVWQCWLPRSIDWIVASETIEGGKLFNGGNCNRIYSTMNEICMFKMVWTEIIFDH